MSSFDILKNKNLIIAEDDPQIQRLLDSALSESFAKIRFVGTCAEALSACNSESFDMGLIDYYLPDGCGVSLIGRMKLGNPGFCALVITKEPNYAHKSHALEAGASDYIIKPFNLAKDKIAQSDFISECRIRIGKVIVSRAKTLSLIEKNRVLQSHIDIFHYQIIGMSSAMASLRTHIEVASQSKHNILITGEAGTGKKLAATNIVRKNPQMPVSVLDCRAVPSEEIELLLFGQVAGVFEARLGLLHTCNSGFLLIYHVDELPSIVQWKLNQVLEENAYLPLGSGEKIPSHLRIVCTSSKDIYLLARTSGFNFSLLQKMSAYHIQIEPLRAHSEDIPDLAVSILLSMAGARYSLAADVIPYLKGLPWQHNMRELKLRIEAAYLVAVKHDRFELKIDDFTNMGDYQGSSPMLGALTGVAGAIGKDNDLRQLFPQSQSEIDEEHFNKALSSVEKRYLQGAMKLCGNDISKLADLLALSRTTLYARLKQYRIAARG
jgi:two-component system response regulator AtoC